MTIERRVPPNHKVVRRIDFGGDEDDQAKRDNLNNQMKELHERDVKIMTEKYNFDFKNEVALRGNYIWFKKRDSGVGWFPMEVKEFLGQNDNERTPMHSRATAPATPRKRKGDDAGILNSNVKKRLEMEKQ